MGFRIDGRTLGQGPAPAFPPPRLREAPAYQPPRQPEPSQDAYREAAPRQTLVDPIRPAEPVRQPEPIRQLRDLTRYQKRLIQDRTRESNRVAKVLEDAVIKLGSVASDVLGVSSRAMIEALIAGERDPEKLAQLAKGQLRNKIPDLVKALDGRFSGHHATMLRLHLDHVDYLEIRGLDLGDAPAQGDARLFVSAVVGGVRLTDNVGLPLGIGFRNIEG